MGGFDQIWGQLVGQVINVPLINPLSFAYVILNFILLVVARLFGGGTTQNTQSTGFSLF